MGAYTLTEEQEDDFKFANNGKDFGKYLEESLEAWKVAADTNRRSILIKAHKEIDPETMKKLISIAKLSPVQH